MNPAITVVGVIVALALSAAAVHLLLTWMERRGWIWYRSKHRPRPSSLGLLEEIYQPSVEHLIDQQVEDDTTADHVTTGEPEDDPPED